MNARVSGMSKASTFLNPEFCSRLRANVSAPETVVRCERPMATMSFDSTSTSPPSME